VALLRERDESIREMKERKARIQRRRGGNSSSNRQLGGDISLSLPAGISDAVGLPDHLSAPAESCDASLASESVQSWVFGDEVGEDQGGRGMKIKKFAKEHPEKFSEVQWGQVLDWPDVKTIECKPPSTALRREIRSARMNKRRLNPSAHDLI
jgi:hypothetical protein